VGGYDRPSPPKPEIRRARLGQSGGRHRAEGGGRVFPTARRIRRPALSPDWSTWPMALRRVAPLASITCVEW